MSSQGMSPGLLNKYALHAALCISEGHAHAQQLQAPVVEQLCFLRVGGWNEVSSFGTAEVCIVILPSIKACLSFQGLQIFILYTVRTKIFQSEASKILKSLSSSFDRTKPMPSITPLKLRVRMYNMLRSLPSLNERFRLLEPSGMTEETSLSWKWPSKIKCLTRLLPMMVFWFQLIRIVSVYVIL